MTNIQDQLLDAADEWEEDEDELEGDDSFAQLFEQSQFDQIKLHNVVKGKVVKIENDFVIVDVGHKTIGQVSLHEFTAVEGEEPVHVEDEVDVFIDSFEDDRGLMVLSKHKADMMKAWDQIQSATEKDEVIEGKIVSKVKGGLAVDIGVKAFLPGSQIDLRPIRNLDKLIGHTYKFKVIKFNKKRGNIVLSRRALLEKDREALKEKTLKTIKEGEILMGVVKNITDYGAFIDLGGVDGLLHITDMSWGRISHPSELFQVGDEIKVKILSFDREKQRVSLGLKQILPDPWEQASEKYAPGMKVKGRVVSIADYGAFVELEEGIEGLIHVSEMSWSKRNKSPSKFVEVGQEVEVQVLEISTENKRISLGMKQITPNPWLEIASNYEAGQIIKGKIRNITDFGLFIGIEDGIDGLVHVSDISWTERVKHPGEMFTKGQEIEAKVLNIDVDNERFSLGIKQLEEDPWEKAKETYAIGSSSKGIVLRTAAFGVFVELEKGVEGLIHLSELDEAEVEKAEDICKEGDELEFVILSFDAKERKIALSRKKFLTGEEVIPEPEEEDAEEQEPQSAMGEAFQKAQKQQDVVEPE